MFAYDEKDMKLSLGQMFVEARQKANFDHDSAKQILKQYVSADRRFDAYAKDRLVERVGEVMQGGGHLDLTDPWLRGGSKRPGSR
jgi:hypothetical protein